MKKAKNRTVSIDEIIDFLDENNFSYMLNLGYVSGIGINVLRIKFYDKDGEPINDLRFIIDVYQDVIEQLQSELKRNGLL